MSGVANDGDIRIAVEFAPPPRRSHPTYSVARFLAVPLGKGKAKAVLIATTHAVYYPSQVALLLP